MLKRTKTINHSGLWFGSCRTDSLNHFAGLLVTQDELRRTVGNALFLNQHVICIEIAGWKRIEKGWKRTFYLNGKLGSFSGP
jgi:hypothetical protein